MVNPALFSSDKTNWETPQELFDTLDRQHKFTLDAASSDENAKCEKHYTEADDGLSKSWAGERVFVNPPYGRTIASWVKKAHDEHSDAYVVMLLPARTDTAWFHDYIYGRADVDVYFMRGRVKFELNGEAKQSAPFPSMVAVFW